MPAYPGMPYGLAPSWCFPVFEISMYLLLIICLTHAAKRGSKDVIYILGALGFGLILEYIEVISRNYTYRPFMVMFGKAPFQIPLCIGAGWGIIIYSARQFSDKLGLPLLAAAALDTLLALNIDLSMDTVAYRLHMWHWNWPTNFDPLTAQWFGIPYGNFIGWQTVVFCYAVFSRWFEKKLARPHGNSITTYISIALLALICSQAVLFTTENYLYPFLHDHLGILSLYRFVANSIILVVLVILGWRKKKLLATGIPALAWWVPAWFHIYFAACFFMLGFYAENKWMTMAACANLLTGIILHTFPFQLNTKRSANRIR